MSCPHCSAQVAEQEPRCPSCQIDLTSADARRLAELSGTIAGLRAEGAEVATRLRNEAIAHAGQVSQASPAQPIPAFVPPPRQAVRRATESKPTNIKNLLLALGGVFCSLAGLLFVAVSWSHIGIGGRTAIMLTVTALTALGAHAAYRKQLTGTAETLSVTAIVFALIDAGAAHSKSLLGLGDIETWLYWAIVFAVLALITAGYRTQVKLHSHGLFALLAAQLPLHLYLANGPGYSGSEALFLSLESLQLLVLVVFCGLFLRKRGGSLLLSVGITTAALHAGWLFMQVAVLLLVTGFSSEQNGALTTFIGASAVIVSLSLSVRLAKATDKFVTVADGAAMLLVVVAVYSYIGYFTGGDWMFLAFCVMGVITAALIVPVKAGAPGLLMKPVASSFVVIGLAGFLGDVISAVSIAMSCAFNDPDSLRSLSTFSDSPGGEYQGSVMAVPALLLAALALLIPSAMRNEVRTGLTRAGYIIGLAVAVVPVALGVPPYIALLSLMAISAAVLLASPNAETKVFRVVGWTLLVQSIAIAQLDEAMSVVMLALATGIGALVSLKSESHRTLSVTFTSLLGLATVASATSTITDNSYAVFTALLVTGLAIAALTDKFAMLGKTRLSGATYVGAISATVSFIVLVGDSMWLSIALGILASTGALVAISPKRRHFAWASATALVALAWLRMGVANVEVPEAYAAPLIALLTAAGYFHQRAKPSLSSWNTYGWALGVTTTLALLALSYDDGLTRAVLYGLGSVAVLLIGASTKRQAPLALGTIVLLWDAMVQFAPYADNIPRWILVGTIGIILVAVGATYERRLRELNTMRSKFTALR